jgi:dihydropyrimidinase
MDVDYSCYEGMEVTGAVDVVLSRGRIVVDGEEWLGEKGGGRFVKRQRSGAFLQ